MGRDRDSGIKIEQDGGKAGFKNPYCGPSMSGSKQIYLIFRFYPSL